MLPQSLLHPLRPRQRIDAIADYHQGEIFVPGAGSQVYDPDFLDPIVSGIGAATACGSAPNPLQPPPLYVPNPMGILTGSPMALGDFESSPLEV